MTLEDRQLEMRGERVIEKAVADSVKRPAIRLSNSRGHQVRSAEEQAQLAKHFPLCVRRSQHACLDSLYPTPDLESVSANYRPNVLTRSPCTCRELCRRRGPSPGLASRSSTGRRMAERPLVFSPSPILQELVKPDPRSSSPIRTRFRTCLRKLRLKRGGSPCGLERQLHYRRQHVSIFNTYLLVAETYSDEWISKSASDALKLADTGIRRAARLADGVRSEMARSNRLPERFMCHLREGRWGKGKRRVL